MSKIPRSEADAPVQILRAGFYQRAIEQALARMTLGCLHITLPGGTTRRFGHAPKVTAHLRVNRIEFFKRCVLYGDIGFGEAYVDGDWDTDNLPAVLGWFVENVEQAPGLSGSHAQPAALNLLRLGNRLKHLFRPNSREGSRQNVADHYGLGNDFYKLWLDESMTASCGIWTSPEQTIEAAQATKYEALCRTLRLKPTDLVLEIGSGWGGFACFAAKKYGCHVTTLTLSKAQHDYCRERFVREGIGDNAEVRMQDYRDITGRFDKIISIEMIEAVGENYVDEFFTQCHRLLKHNGLLALQYITCPDSRYHQIAGGVDWIQKHIAPGSLLMSIGRVNQAIDQMTDMHMFELRDLGLHYVRTLQEWRKRFNARHEELHKLKFDDRFIRKWNYYLSYSEAAFAHRNISVVQAIYTRPNNRTLMAVPLTNDAPSADPKVEAKVEPKVEAKAEPTVATVVEPKVEPIVEPKVESIVETKVELVAEPAAEVTVYAKVEPAVEASAEPIVEAKTEAKVGDDVKSLELSPAPPLPPAPEPKV